MSYRIVKRYNAIGWDWYLESDDCSSWVSPLAKEVIETLEVENTKLRELSATMLKCIEAHRRKKSVCWECPAHKQFDELRWLCCIAHEASELGVGADG